MTDSTFQFSESTFLSSVLSFLAFSSTCSFSRPTAIVVSYGRTCAFSSTWWAKCTEMHYLKMHFAHQAQAQPNAHGMCGKDGGWP
jgi:hypothetical protein